MNSTAFLGFAVASTLASVVVHGTAAQAQSPRSSTTASAPVQVTVPPSGLTFQFSDIDRNGDGSISIVEWNAFVASVQARVAAERAADASSGGTTAAPPQSPRR